MDKAEQELERRRQELADRRKRYEARRSEIDARKELYEKRQELVEEEQRLAKEEEQLLQDEERLDYREIGEEHEADVDRDDPEEAGTLGETADPSYVPNYLVQAILVTIFCCLPLGIVSIVYAAQVNGHVAAGDFAAARRASSKAKTWAWVSFFLGLLWWIPIGSLMSLGSGGS